MKIIMSHLTCVIRMDLCNSKYTVYSRIYHIRRNKITKHKRKKIISKIKTCNSSFPWMISFKIKLKIP